MNYPVWYLPTIGGGTLIALIAIIHVFISHFAVGGGLYLVCAERKGLRENSTAILDFTKKHAKFFLLMTMVMGGITGVGIWFIISLVNPAATSILIHVFVFGWATEWVLFVVEIVSILIYYYCFNRMAPRTHQAVGWIYFVAAWLSLFLINGIIDFMLTPGSWVADRNFWSGFFNPSFWPSLLFRTFISFMLAGVYAFLTTSFLKDAPLKTTMTRYSARWILISLLGAAPAGFWYLSVLPNQARMLIEGASPTILMALQYGLYAVIVLLVGTLLLLLVKPALHSIPVSFIVLAGAFLFLGAFEWTREASRRPYVINEFMYSNSILEKDVKKIDRDGFLHAARWVRVRDVREDNLLEAGDEIFRNQCFSCHTVGGMNNNIAARTAFMDFPSLLNYIDKIHEIRYFMPPFAGNESERKALAYYIIRGIQGKSVLMAKDEKEVQGGQGKKLFESRCTLCHPADLVKARTAAWDRSKIRRALDNLNKLQSAMPDYDGTPKQKDLLADYIFSLRREAGEETDEEGKEVFEEHCAVCHSLRGGSNPVLSKMTGWNQERIRRSLDMLNKMKGGMPPLEEPGEKKDALASFFFKSLQGGAR
jgi:mono/diheme cytochrome c family protein